jgi:hypothetical protein
MELPEEPDLAAMTRPPSRRELCPNAGVPVQVTADPTLAFAQELNGPSLPIGTPRPVGGHGHDHASVRVDDDPERSGARRVTEREGDGAAGEVRHGRGLEGSRRGQQVVALRSITDR